MATTASVQPPFETRGPQLEAVAIFFLSMALTSFALRVFVRLRMVKAFGWDDWLMGCATLAFSAYIICVLAGVHFGTGKHFADISTADGEKALEFWFFCYAWFTWTMMLSKLSIGVFLLRIAVQHRWVLYAAMLVNIISGLIFFLFCVLQCDPVWYFWTRLSQPTAGSCLSVDILVPVSYAYTVLNIICDFVFALLPVNIVWGLNMPQRLKLATVPLLSMGCVASSGAVVRLFYLERFRDPDFLFATTDIAIWASVEAGLAITAASLACVRPLARRVSEHFRTPGQGHSYGTRPSARQSHPMMGYLEHKHDSGRDVMLSELAENNKPDYHQAQVHVRSA